MAFVIILMIYITVRSFLQVANFARPTVKISEQHSVYYYVRIQRKATNLHIEEAVIYASL